MSDDLLDNDLDGQPISTARPQFLTVLCILTFIGSGLAILGLFGQSFAQYNYRGPTWYILMVLACNAATAYGAWEMWNLKKRGLHIYTAGQIVSIILPFLLIYSIMPSMFGGIFGNMFSISSLIPVAFIVMYWVNAKHLDEGYSDLD